MKILVTGFDPFGGENTNPAYEAVKLLPDEILGSRIIKLEVPTAFKRSGEVIETALEEHRPDVVVSVGQAGGRSSISLEKVAINLGEARIADNDGYQPIDEKLSKDGETAYFTSLPIKAMAKKIRDGGIPAHISYTAGTYVCNSLMYNALYLAEKKYKNLRAGFMHVPYSPEQVATKGDGISSMPTETIAQGLKYGIEAIIEGKDLDVEAMGTIS